VLEDCASEALLLQLAEFRFTFPRAVHAGTSSRGGGAGSESDHDDEEDTDEENGHGRNALKDHEDLLIVSEENAVTAEVEAEEAAAQARREVAHSSELRE
jgi:hypothetical protein